MGNFIDFSNDEVKLSNAFQDALAEMLEKDREESSQEEKSRLLSEMSYFLRGSNPSIIISFQDKLSEKLDELINQHWDLRKMYLYYKDTPVRQLAIYSNDVEDNCSSVFLVCTIEEC